MKKFLLSSLLLPLATTAFCQEYEDKHEREYVEEQALLFAQWASLSEQEEMERQEKLKLQKLLELSKKEAEEQKLQQEEADYWMARKLEKELWLGQQVVGKEKEGEDCATAALASVINPEVKEAPQEDHSDCLIGELPDELALYIFNFLSFKEVKNAALVNHTFARVASDRSLLKKFVKSSLQDDPVKVTSIFFAAIRDGDYAVVEEFLKQDNSLADAQLYLENRMDSLSEFLNRPKYSISALMCASEWGHDKIVELLLNYGADVNVRDNLKWGALSYACINGHLEVARILLDNKSPVNLMTSHDETPLLIAANKNYLELVKLLLDYGADINARMNGGETALTMAAVRGYKEMVETLLAHKASVSILDDYSMSSALEYTQAAGHEDIAAILLKAEELS